VIPGEVCLTLDWRNVPAESPADIVAQIGALFEPGSSATVEVTPQKFSAYTGLERILPSVFPPFLLAENHPFLSVAHTTLVEVLGPG